MPVLSVIMPIYNAENFLKRSVDTVLNQTFRDWELILVDDGSTDHSLQLCREYEKKDHRVKVLCQKNAGAGPARNAGIEVASGKYMAFPDSDDFLDLSAYEKSVARLEETKADLLVFGVATEVFNDEENRITDRREESIPQVHVKTREECREKYVYLHKNMNMNSPCNKVYRRELIEKYQLRFPDLRRMQDGVFNMWYFDKIESFCSLSDNLFIRTWHSNEVQSKKMPTSLVDCAVTYHQTAVGMLDAWGKLTDENKMFFDNWFSETLVVAEFHTIPNQKTFREYYKRCRRINNNGYVNAFYKEYGNKRVLNKREKAMYYRANVLIAAFLTVFKRGSGI